MSLGLGLVWSLALPSSVLVLFSGKFCPVMAGWPSAISDLYPHSKTKGNKVLTFITPGKVPVSALSGPTWVLYSLLNHHCASRNETLWFSRLHTRVPHLDLSRASPRQTIWTKTELLSQWKRKDVWLCVTPKMAAHQASPSLGFSRQEHWSGLPFPSLMHESEKWKWSCSVVSDSLRPHGLQPTRLLHPWDFPGKSTRVGCHCLLRIDG